MSTLHKTDQNLEIITIPLPIFTVSFLLKLEYFKSKSEKFKELIKTSLLLDIIYPSEAMAVNLLQVSTKFCSMSFFL